MSDIRIFVSHRTDMESELVDNPIYFPVRCGAVFDPWNSAGLAGDDTGDNISDKKANFSEFTVQYWAWKNVDADFYGLCHYRRFLSFSENTYPSNEYGMVTSFILNRKSMERFGLLDSAKMAEVIGNYDIVLSERADVTRQPTPVGTVATVRQLWDAHNGIFIQKEVIDEMFRLIDRRAPEYSRSAREYFEGKYHRGYNCYVMKRELFHRMCEFQFPILFELLQWVKQKPYHETFPRTVGYVGEMLYGIFTYHVTTYEAPKVKELQLVLFNNTKKIRKKSDILRIYLDYGADKVVRAIADVLLPKGSNRRNVVKGYWYRFKNYMRKR